MRLSSRSMNPPEGKEEETERSVKETDAGRLFVFPSLERGYGEAGGHTVKQTHMCSNRWKDGRDSLWFI